MKKRLAPGNLAPTAIFAILFGIAPPFAGAGGSAEGPTPPEPAAWLGRVGSRSIRAHDPSTIVKCKVRVGRSEKITGPYRDRNGVDMLLGGGTLVLGTTGPFIGPGHAGIISEGSTNWLSCHFYDRTRRGAPTLAILPLRWNTNGWPEVVMPPTK